MAALAALSIAVWLLAATAAAVSNFNRTIFGINPGLHFEPRHAAYVANETSGLSAQDASFWSLGFDLQGLAKPTSYPEVDGVVKFNFNGTGVKVYASIVGTPPRQLLEPPSLRLVSASEERLTAPVRTTDVGAREGASMTWLAEAEADHSEWLATLSLPTNTKWVVDNITLMYTLE